MVLKIVSNADAGDADHVGGNDWDTLVGEFESPLSASYIIYISGSNIKVRNATTQETPFTGAVAHTVIQALLTSIGANTGARIYIKEGIYSLTDTLIPVQNSAVHITGSAQNGFTNLVATTDVPAIKIFGSWNTLENLYFSHNQAGYTSKLVNITGGTENTFKNLKFYDGGNKAGSAFGLNNTATASIYRNHFNYCHVEGFDSVIHATVEDFATGSRFINKNDFTGLNCTASKRILKVTGATGSVFDDNNFFNCYLQGYAGTLCGWDYETGNSGHSWYTNHFGCFIDDLPGGINYALLNANTEIFLHGCHPDWKIGGAGASATTIQRRGLYSDRIGVGTFSGDGSTKTFVVTHNMNASVAPTKFFLQPMSADAIGTPWVDPATATVTQFTITYPVAPPSGSSNVKLSWRCAY